MKLDDFNNGRAAQEAVDKLTAWPRVEPQQMRRIFFLTDKERIESHERMDQLLAWCWAMQGELDNLPASREKALALTKLEEFAMWARLAYLNRVSE